jgi:hypothetical protein
MPADAGREDPYPTYQRLRRWPLWRWPPTAPWS